MRTHHLVQYFKPNTEIDSHVPVTWIGLLILPLRITSPAGDDQSSHETP